MSGELKPNGRRPRLGDLLALIGCGSTFFATWGLSVLGFGYVLRTQRVTSINWLIAQHTTSFGLASLVLIIWTVWAKKAIAAGRLWRVASIVAAGIVVMVLLTILGPLLQPA